MINVAPSSVLRFHQDKIWHHVACCKPASVALSVASRYAVDVPSRDRIRIRLLVISTVEQDLTDFTFRSGVVVYRR